MRPRLSILLMLLVLALAPNVLADSYTFTTSGCFSGNGATCSSNGSSSMNFSGLFGPAATLSFSNIASSTTVSSGSTFSLGSLDLSILNLGLGTTSPGSTFTLNLDFTNPAGSTGNPFVASVKGGILFELGGAVLTFDNPAQVFTYPGGSFALDLTSDTIVLSTFNQTAVIGAKIVGVPEGSSLAMLGISGLVLLGAFFKKRKLLAASNAC